MLEDGVLDIIIMKKDVWNIMKYECYCIIRKVYSVRILRVSLKLYIWCEMCFL